MFSWLNKDNKNDENKSNDLEEKMVDTDVSAPDDAAEHDNIIPTAENFPLHASVLKKDAKSLIKHIESLPAVDALLPDKMKPINQKDHHGNTALHLCVYLSWDEGIDILLKYGASPTVRSRSGWTAIQEAVSTSQRAILKKLFKRNMEEVREGLALRSPIIRKKLREKDDFYVEIDWKFTSWIPFVSRFCPCDTFKIWKRGSDFRLDMTLVDFESFAWRRGHISFIFLMNPKTDKAEFYVLNHVDKTKQVTNKQKELEESKNEKDIDVNIEHLLQSELVSPEVLTSKIEIAKSKSWLGYEKLMEINGTKCTLYELKNLIVLANKRDSHVPQEVKEQRALTKQLFQSKVEASKKGEKVEFEDLQVLTESYWQCEKCQNLNKNEYVFCEQCANNKPEALQSPNTADQSNGDQPKEQQVTDEDKENKNDNNDENEDDKQKKAVSTASPTSLSSIFGDVKRYDYPEWKAPQIEMEKYFDYEEWSKHKMEVISNHMNKKKVKATEEVVNERKETFVCNPAPSAMTTKSFKLNLAMTENFGLSVEEIVAILEAAAPQSKLAAKLKEFLEIKMPRGFPIQLELPLFHVLKATVTFQNFEHINPPDEIFDIPTGYAMVEGDKKLNENSVL
eukprot:CAMPEP_0197037438 /NCGR_PEP_ID=MMETSP1384-20130603/14653_1 /TAXON_ID=29189 /ORGANISM="Ammonia sp." /LENGTH=621 /DNA_ID=CAMNT_0042467747 /DNA_START=36 /DNA_END=1901 /DNA_ORIENTATION=+